MWIRSGSVCGSVPGRRERSGVASCASCRKAGAGVGLAWKNREEAGYSIPEIWYDSFE